MEHGITPYFIAFGPLRQFVGELTRLKAALWPVRRVQVGRLKKSPLAPLMLTVFVRHGSDLPEPEALYAMVEALRPGALTVRLYVSLIGRRWGLPRVAYFNIYIRPAHSKGAGPARRLTRRGGPAAPLAPRAVRRARGAGRHVLLLATTRFRWFTMLLFLLRNALFMFGLMVGCGLAAQAQAFPEPGKRPHPPMRRSRFDASRPPALNPLPANAVSFCPLVELQALNRAYVRELSRRRQLRQPLPPSLRPVQYDSLLLPGTVLHNQRLVNANGALFHDYQQPHAELVGYRSDLTRYRDQPAQLAHAIWQVFDDSKKGHKEAQQDHRFTHVSVSCSDTYFVVRLDHQPSTTTKVEQKGYAQWQKQHVRVP